MRMGLKMEDRNLLVRALRAGKSWSYAKSLLPGVDREALENFKSWAEERAAEASGDETEETEVKGRPSAADVKAATDEIEKLRKQLDETRKAQEALAADNAKLKEQVEFYADPEPTKADGGKKK